MINLEFLCKLNSFLNSFRYGVPYNGHILIPDDAEEFTNVYHYLSPKEFLKYRCGVCWDYTAFQSEELRKHHANYTNFYVELGNPKSPDTHTFTVVKIGDKYIYIESSFKMIQGVYVSSNLTDIIDYVIYNMAKYSIYKDFEKIVVVVRAYKDNRNYGENSIEFTEDMHKSPIIFTTKKKKKEFQNCEEKFEDMFNRRK